MSHIFYAFHRSLWTIVISFSFLGFTSLNGGQKDETLDKRSAKIQFSLVGTYHSENPLFQFLVITPDKEERTKTIRSNHVIGHVKSKIKTRRIAPGNYLLILRNISSSSLSFIGGFVASKNSLHGEVQKSPALNLSLTPGQEVIYLYSIEQGFDLNLPPSSDEILLKWDPFDWLGL